MPNITVDGPILSDTQKKRELVKKLTDAAQEAYGIKREAFVVIIKENRAENIGVGGELLVDRHRKE